jgi:hypothetical protein
MFQCISEHNQQVDKHQQRTHQKRPNNETKSATHDYYVIASSMHNANPSLLQRKWYGSSIEVTQNNY